MRPYSLTPWKSIYQLQQSRTRLLADEKKAKTSAKIVMEHNILHTAICQKIWLILNLKDLQILHPMRRLAQNLHCGIDLD